MITKHDLDAAIAECIGTRNPDSSTCIKLAAFYTIRREMFSDEAYDGTPSYSYSPPPTQISFPGESDFLRSINGRQQDEIWPIMDELMEALSVIQPRLYEATMRKIQD